MLRIFGEASTAKGRVYYHRAHAATNAPARKLVECVKLEPAAEVDILG